MWCSLGSPTADQKLLSIASMTLSTQLWLGYGGLFSTLLQIVQECSGSTKKHPTTRNCPDSEDTNPMLQSRDVIVKTYHHALKESISTIHSEAFHMRRNTSITLILHLVMKGFFCLSCFHQKVISC